QDAIAYMPGPGDAVPPQYTFSDGTQLCDSGLASRVAKIRNQLHSPRSTEKGVLQHEQFGLGVHISGAHSRVQEGAADLDALTLGPDVQEAARADDPVFRKVAEGVRQPPARARFPFDVRPKSVEVSALSTHREQVPRGRVAVQGNTDLRLQRLLVRLQSNQTSRQRNAFQEASIV